MITIIKQTDREQPGEYLVFGIVGYIDPIVLTKEEAEDLRDILIKQL